MHEEIFQIPIIVICYELILLCLQNFADIRISLCPSYDYITIKEEIQ